MWYGASVKQYGTDLTVSLFLVWLALRVREHPERLRRAATAGVAGGAAILLSHPAVVTAFVLGCALAILGMGVIHVVLGRTIMKPVILVLIYLGLFLTPWIAPIVALVGVYAPGILLVSFIPMLLIASAFNYMNKADQDCGTTFSWVTRAMGPWWGWQGGWAIAMTGVAPATIAACKRRKHAFMLTCPYIVL